MPFNRRADGRGYSFYPRQLKKPRTLKGVGKAYSKVADGGVVHFFYLDDSGVEHQLTPPQGGGGAAGAPLTVFLNIGGNDANDGLTALTAVASWARVWAIGVENNAVPLIVDVAGGGYFGDYVVPPASFTWVILQSDEFTDVASGAAGPGTTALQIELALAGIEDEYRHRTLRFDDGPAAGYRRQIRDNSTTDVFPVQGFENFGAIVAPLPGDTYRISEPANTFGGDPEDVSPGSTYQQFVLCHPTTRLDIINLAIEPTNPRLWFYNWIVHPGFGQLFGAVVNDDWSIDQRYGELYGGADDALTSGQVGLLMEAIGNAGYVHGQWHGWGLGFSETGFLGLSNPRNGLSTPVSPTNNDSLFYGFCTGSTLTPSNCMILGGSFPTIAIPDNGRLGIAVANLQRNFSTPVNRLLLKTDFPFGAITGGSNSDTFVRYTYANRNNAIEIRHLGSTSNGQIGAGAGARITMSTGMDIEYAGAGASSVARATSAGGVISLRGDAFGGASVWNMGASGILARAAAGGTITAASYVANVAAGVINDGGNVTLEQVGGTTPIINSFESLWVQSSGQGKVGGSITATCTSAANGLDIQGGDFEQVVGGTVSFVNTSVLAGTSGFKCDGGARANLIGGANTVIDASAAASGFGCNARGGGRVYFANPPTGVSGPPPVPLLSDDLTVGTNAGENQPNTFLAVALDSLVSVNTLSSMLVKA